MKENQKILRNSLWMQSIVNDSHFYLRDGDLMLISINKFAQLDKLWLRVIYAYMDEVTFDRFLCDAEESIRNHNGMFYFWEESGQIVATVRTEPYKDGTLFFNLETHPEYRRCGYGTMLVKAVLDKIRSDSIEPIYVHIDKKNVASLKLHQNIGFQICAEYGKLIDGSISHRYYTLIYK